MTDVTNSPTHFPTTFKVARFTPHEAAAIAFGRQAARAIRAASEGKREYARSAGESARYWLQLMLTRRMLDTK